MGRKSTKVNKSIYQVSREKVGYSREQVSEKIAYISPERIEKIENYKMKAHPEDIFALAEFYKMPLLCNYYCTHECVIGQKYVPEAQIKELPQIVLETVNLLNRLNREKDRFIEIAVNGEISPEEYEDFKRIQDLLEKISITVENLRFWVDKKVAEGEL